MVSRLTEVAIDCADPHALAGFWCAVLDYEVHDEDAAEGIVIIGPRGGTVAVAGPVPPQLTFARVPEPKTVKNRLHLDVNPVEHDQQAEVARLLDLGASYADVGQGADVTFVVLRDPEGNEFCVLRPRRA